MSSLYLSTLLTALLQYQSDVANQFNGYLILGYAAMWVIGMIYVISLASRQNNLKQDIQLMQQLLQEDINQTE